VAERKKEIEELDDDLTEEDDDEVELSDDEVEDEDAAAALDDDDDDDSEDASLDELLAQRSAARRGTDDSDEDADEILSFVPEPDMGSVEPLPSKILPVKDQMEFVCKRCHLAKKKSQLADAERMLCRDCV
jgi:hypothetical protein